MFLVLEIYRGNWDYVIVLMFRIFPGVSSRIVGAVFNDFFVVLQAFLLWDRMRYLDFPLKQFYPLPLTFTCS